jgi:hypothetical protein
MGNAVALLAILGYGLYINRLVRWQLESSLLFVSASLICLLYFAGLFGYLDIVAQAILGIGALLFITSIFSHIRSGANVRSMSPGVMFFLMSTIGLWILTRSEYYSNFIFVDDFDHWGRMSRIIAENDRLIILTDPLGFKDYPPGMGLFDYLFFQFSKFSENNAMFAHGVFIFAALSQLFSVFPKENNKFLFFGVSIFIYTLIYFFGLGLHTLAGDLILGVVFGVGLFQYLAVRESGRLVSILRLIPLVMVLPLIKLVGVLFSFVIAGVVVSDLVFASINRREKIKLIIVSSLLFVMSFLVYASWGEHNKNLGMPQTMETNVAPGEVVNAFIPSLATERQKVTIDNFISRVFLPHPESKVSRQYYWFAVCLLFLWLLWYAGKDYKSWVKFVPFVVLFAGFCAYIGILLLLYMFSFGAYEGPRLASFERYVSSYLVGVLIVLFGLSLSQLFKEKWNKTATVSMVIICILVMLPNLKAGLLDVFHVARGEIRGEQNRDIESVSKYWKVIKDYTAPNAKIYFLWQGSDSTEYHIFLYGIVPRKFNGGCWSVGEPLSSGDVWTCRMTSSEFEQELKGYDYLLVANADKKFEDIFSSLFGAAGVQNGTLYQILKDKHHIKLQNISAVPSNG